MRGGSVNTMKSIRNSILVIVILLSLSAGAVKLMKMPQEVKIFHDAGLGVTLLVILGAVQLFGVFCLYLRSREFTARLLRLDRFSHQRS